MSGGPDYKPPYRVMYAGLAFAALAQVALIAMWIEGDLGSIVPAGNFSALVITLGAIWLIRQREKGRL